MSGYRKVLLAEDYDYIMAALLRLEEYAKEYKWASGVNVDLAAYNLITYIEAGQGYVVDGYLVMVDEIKPWYSNEPILTEWLVLKLFPGGSVDSVPAALIQIAKNRGISMIMTADSSPVNIVAGAYKRAGFNPLTTSFFTVV